MLRVLKLSGNKSLGGILEFELPNGEGCILPLGLIELSVARCYLVRINAIVHLKHLQILDLGDNRITDKQQIWFVLIAEFTFLTCLAF